MFAMFQQFYFDRCLIKPIDNACSICFRLPKLTDRGHLCVSLLLVLSDYLKNIIIVIVVIMISVSAFFLF